MALAGALAVGLCAVTGFTNRNLRGLVAGLLNRELTPNQMTYDLRRLRCHGLIERIPHTNGYHLTPAGIRWAIFTTKLHDRLLKPLIPPDNDTNNTPPDLRAALRAIDRHIDTQTRNARLQPAA